MTLTVGERVVSAPSGVDASAINADQDLDRAAAEAEKVIRQHPEYLPAYYVAGTLTTSRAKAKSYLTAYVRKAPRDTARYRYALQRLPAVERR